ncbi:TonB family protein [Phenylobacterium sp.]|uniref:TonB family protein n=1 Tax=Phenylobacterium sp. TaxID=1871053 RepID=UPI0025D4530B|nr:TonB family protein [Phenylobacterium sp.]
MSSKLVLLAGAAAAAVACALAATASAQAEHFWVDAPTVADVASAYPARAKAAGVSGQVELTCELARDGHPRDCAALTEKPGGYGFGAAAAKLATHLKMSDQSLTKQNIFIPVSFDAAVLKGEATVTKPAWAALPSPEDFNATFPKTQNGVNKVRVVLGCTVEAGGALGGCSVAQEDPAGQGYGAGALALASKFRVGPWSEDGTPTVGAHIRLPIRYELTPVKP